MTEVPAVAVPTIDVDRDPAAVGREVDETLREVGFFQIVGHGVPPAVADACWDATRAFFDLPIAEKQHVERGADGLYGWFPMRSESLGRTEGSTPPGDLKESFNAGAGAFRDASWPFADATEAALFAPVAWPAEPAGLRDAWAAYFAAMSALSDRLMSAFALGLGLPADWFAGAIDRSPSALRTIDYPAQQAAPAPGQLRAGAHTDYGTLTILRQQTGRAGLQVHDERSQAWVDVPAVEGALVINIGDLMARWTNDRWTSTLHRVVVADGPSERRQSMPFFHSANCTRVIECLPTCVGAGARHRPVVAGPHLAARARASRTAA